MVLCIAAQSGKTEALLDIIGQRLDQQPAPILYVGPNRLFITEQFEPRLMELLDQAPALRDKVARGKRMTKSRKLIAGVSLRLAHAGSSTALKSDPAALALTDEADELMANVKGQGDPIGLIDRRGETYTDFVHAIVSTPSVGPSDVVLDPESGLEFWAEEDPSDLQSPIWRLWQSGTRYHFAWPCPHCRDYFIPRFRCLVWPKGSSPAEALTKAHVACPRCGGLIDNAAKNEMNTRGVFVAPGQRVEQDGTVIGDPPFSTTASFWVSGLCSPFSTFGERASEYLQAVRSGNHEEIQTVINGGFGELWAPSGGDAPEWSEIARKGMQSGYARGTVPDEVRYLTLGVDVQKRGIWWLVRGWGARATSWLIDYGYLEGDTAEEDVWVSLADLVTGTIDDLPIRLAFVDSGFRPGKTDALPLNRVYDFCSRFPGRVKPSKGSSNPMRTPLSTSRIEVTASGKRAKFGIELVMLDTDHWKSWVHERVRWPQGTIGAWYLPRDVGDDYARQIASEARVKRPSGRAQWIQRHRDNHLLDCEAMASAAAFQLGAQRLPGTVGQQLPPPADEESPEPDDTPPVAPQQRRTLDDVLPAKPKAMFRRGIARSGHMAR